MFRDADPIEDEMGVRVEYMNPAQLQEYIQMFHRGLRPDPGVSEVFR